MEKKQLIQLLNERYQNNLAQIVVNKEFLFAEINNIGNADKEEVNWLYRKSNGLLYFYKHKPSVIKTSLPFSPESYEVKRIVGDKETLLPEKDNNLSYIPKNVLIHRDDLGKYKKEE